MKVKFKRFSSCARVPQKAIIGSAFNDFFAAKPVGLESNSTRLVETDIGFCFSKKNGTKIYPRSSLSLFPAFVRGGMIDSDFRGNVRVILSNFSSSRVAINAGDRIAKVIFKKKEDPDFVEVFSWDDFPTKRGADGFGSTGI